MALSLSTLNRSGVNNTPPRLLIYGRGKTGKTTLASEFPDPIFIQTEGGTGDLDLTSFSDRPFSSFEQFEEAVELLFEGGHGFKTVVIDSLTQLEPLVWGEACRRNGWASVEEPGYGKGYVAVDDVWLKVLGGLTSLTLQGMTVIAIAHEQVESFNNPEGPDYDRYRIRLNIRKNGGGAEPMAREWADVVGFLNTVVMVDKRKGAFGKETVKAVGSGQRVLHLTPRPAFEAGSRYRNTPDSVLINKGSGYAALAPFLPGHRDAKASAAA